MLIKGTGLHPQTHIKDVMLELSWDSDSFSSANARAAIKGFSGKGDFNAFAGTIRITRLQTTILTFLASSFVYYNISF